MSVLPIFILIGLPLAEIYLFAAFGERLGGGTIVALCILSAALGLFVLRRHGVGAILKAQQSLVIGKPPVKELLTGVLVIIGGFLLVLPGFITDILGLLLFTEWGRLILVVAVLRHMRPQFFTYRAEPHTDTGQHRRPQNPSIIEGDYRVENDPSDKKH
jgi:UPF0716 protein FxsA